MSGADEALSAVSARVLLALGLLRRGKVDQAIGVLDRLASTLPLPEHRHIRAAARDAGRSAPRTRRG